MKIIKKIGLILMIAAMLLSLQLPGMIVHAAETGSITLHKYRAIGDIKDYNLPGNGSEITGDPIVTDSGLKLSDLQKLEGVTFTIEKVVLKAGYPAPEPNSIDINDYIPDAINPFFNSDKTDANGELKWSDLPLGIYLITEIMDNDTVKAGETIDPFLVSIPMTNPTGDANDLYNIHVYPKNVSRKLDPVKEFVDPDDNTGSNILNWKISVAIPSDIDTYTKLTVTDPLDSRLTYISSTAEIYYTRADGSIQYLINPTHYTEDYDTTSNTLVYDITPAGFAELANAHSVTGATEPTLYFCFGTMIRDLDPSNPEDWAAIINIANMATVDYDTYTTPIQTDPFGIEITKKDKDNESITLEGAKFMIYPSQDDAANKTNALKNPVNSNEEWEVTTDINGKAHFYGLSHGTYWLVETKTPSSGGYHLPDEPYKVEVLENGETIVEVIILNKKGFVLPTTGGEGTLMYTIGGAIMIALSCGALVVYLKSKKTRSTGK